jgi:hypothetical protein
MAQTIVGVIVIVFFAAWWLLTLAFQLNLPWARRLKLKDTFHLLPKWTFFAPQPRIHDYNFLYRDARRDGSVGKWIDATVAKGGTATKWLWNPRKRLSKSLGDGLRRERALRGEARLLLRGIRPEMTVAYRRLHHFFWRQPRASEAAARQFIVTKTVGYLDLGIEPKTVFLSEFRPLEQDHLATRVPRWRSLCPSWWGSSFRPPSCCTWAASSMAPDSTAGTPSRAG